MDEAQQLRYSRHIVLPQMGVAGQDRLLGSRVLIVGLGGLGSPAAFYLAASGVGHLVLADFDCVELSNLQRQIIHTTGDCGRLKVASARDRLLALNPSIRVTALARAPDEEDLAHEVDRAQVVLDATDNFESRFEINEACVRAKTPLVSGAAIRGEGQVTVFDLSRLESPCYRCLYSDESPEGETCAQAGVFSPLLGVIGSIQAAEAIKILTGVGDPLVGRLVAFDAMAMTWKTFRFTKDPGCPVCSTSSEVG